MGFVTSTFTACCREAVEAEAVTLPLSDEKMAEIVSLLDEEDAYTFAALRSESTYETVKLYMSSGSLIMDRAQEGTAAVKHPCGTFVCLTSPTTVATIKALICEYDCCEDGDCECEKVQITGSALPALRTGTAWEGAVVASGKLPIVFAISGQPSWMNVTMQGCMLKLSGTPTSTSASFSVAAANCNGTAIDVQHFSV